MHFLSVCLDISNFTNFPTFSDPSAINQDFERVKHRRASKKLEILRFVQKFTSFHQKSEAKVLIYSTFISY